jgi:hypothetical protein
VNAHLGRSLAFGVLAVLIGPASTFRASAVFLEGTTDPAGDAALIAAFSSAWFGSATPPDGVLIGAYGGSGLGMGGSGDAVNLFDSTDTRVTGVRFDAVPAGTPVATFDNSARLGSATLPLPVIAAVSAAGFNGELDRGNIQSMRLRHAPR